MRLAQLIFISSYYFTLTCHAGHSALQKIVGSGTECKSNRSGSFPEAKQLREFIGNRTPKSRRRALCRMPGKRQQNKACALGWRGRSAARASRAASPSAAPCAAAGRAARISARIRLPRPHAGLHSSSTSRALGERSHRQTLLACKDRWTCQPKASSEN